MTVSEMHSAVRLGLDKTSSFEYASFLTEELDFWLNEAQERFIKQRLFGNNYRQEKYDKSQKRIDDLRTLIVQTPKISLVQSSIAENVKECYLPKNVSDGYDPYLSYINSSLYNSTTGVLQTGDILSFDLISKYLKDDINNPYIRRPLVTFYHGFNSKGIDKIVFIHGDEFIPTKCDITYVTKAYKLVSGTPSDYETNTCDLPEHTHREIVAMCVEMLIENIESPRVQTYSQINASKVE